MQLTGELNAVDAHSKNSNTHQMIKDSGRVSCSDTIGLEIKLFESQEDFSGNIIATIKSNTVEMSL